MSAVLDDINPDAVALVPFSEETLAPLVALANGGVMTATSLQLGGDIEYDAYEALGTALGAFDRACRWWVGDWLLYGEEAYDSDRYAQAAALTGLSEQSLLDRIWMSRAIPPSRRNPLVGYTCHRAVAPLPARQQTRWLRYAEEHHSTVSSLKAAIKLAAQEPVDTRIETSGADSHEEWTAADLLQQARMATGLLYGSLTSFPGIPKKELPELIEHAENAVEQWTEILSKLKEELK